MISLGFSHIAGACLTLLLIAGIGVQSGRNVKSASDFAIGGGRSTAFMVAGAIIGTLVGGSSTVATSQLAFEYGFSALWFCLGGGIGCLFLALFFVRPMRRTGCMTLQEMIQKEYGPRAGLFTSVLGALGIFLNIIAQLMSAMALLSALVPLPPLACSLFAAGLMVCYVLFGGLRGAVLFLPLCGALFFGRRVDPGFALAAIIAGPLFVLVGSVFLDLSFDPLFLGMGAALVAMLLGMVKGGA